MLVALYFPDPYLTSATPACEQRAACAFLLAAPAFLVSDVQRLPWSVEPLIPDLVKPVPTIMQKTKIPCPN